MKKVMILAVIAAIVGLSVPVSVSSQSPSSTQDEQGVQGTGSQGSQGTGSQGSQGTGSSGTGSQGTGTQGTGSSGSGSQGTGSQGTGSQGTGSQGTQGTMGTGSQSASQYSEMKTVDLPASVSTSISEKYPGYRTEKAFRGKDGSYKVTISKDNDKQTLFFDQKGESIKMQK